MTAIVTHKNQSNIYRQLLNHLERRGRCQKLPPINPILANQTWAINKRLVALTRLNAHLIEWLLLSVHLRRKTGQRRIQYSLAMRSLTSRIYFSSGWIKSQERSLNGRDLWQEIYGFCSIVDGQYSEGSEGECST